MARPFLLDTDFHMSVAFLRLEMPAGVCLEASAHMAARHGIRLTLATASVNDALRKIETSLLVGVGFSLTYLGTRAGAFH